MINCNIQSLKWQFKEIAIHTRASYEDGYHSCEQGWVQTPKHFSFEVSLLLTTTQICDIYERFINVTYFLFEILQKFIVCRPFSYKNIHHQNQISGGRVTNDDGKSEIGILFISIFQI